jgi:peptidoglycan/LPS O-acetylase OafA/YrhL
VATLTDLRPALPADAPAVRPDGPPVAAPHRTVVREEIQALRALAVLVVVLYHLFPAAIRGGFVGVDVFFAISGFLITSLLVREADRTGGLRLAGFWARRARRLLPAALLVVLACAVATVALVPLGHWEQFFAELRAGTAYVQNWQLAGAAVDYFAPTSPSPVQHFWSLSAEEQFYLAWPLLLLGALAATRRRPARTRRRAIAAVLGVTTLASLAYAIHATAADPAVAYFATPARAWEFGAGGLLALVGARAAPARARAVLSWVGLAAILAAALGYTDATPFPGWAALLPVLGTLAVIRAGMPRARLAPSRVLGARPVQLLGDVSYAVYLWHWPLLVFAPYALGRPAGVGTAAAIFALTLVLAVLTKRWVEDPVRRAGALRARPPRATLALAAAATALVIGVTVAGSAHVHARIAGDERAAERILADQPRCFGAASRDPQQPCENPGLADRVVPTPVAAPKLDNAPCRMIERANRLRVCAFGAAPERARRTVAIVGDSHASHWRPALAIVARAEGWRVLSITRTGCPFSAATPDLPGRARANCVQWNREVRAWFAAHPEVSSVMVAAHAGAGVVAAPGVAVADARRDGYARAWSALPGSVRDVVVLRDTPRMRGATLDCVASAMGRHADAARACAVPRDFALKPDAAVAAASSPGGRRVRAVDLTDVLCDDARCLPVVGGALVYKDEDHFTPVFAATLAPQLRRALRSTA